MTAYLIKPSILRLTLTITFLLLMCAPSIGQTAGEPEVKPAPTDKPARYTIESGKPPHPYKFHLEANELLQIRVEQLGADVLLRLLDASGNEVAWMNFHNRADVLETLTFVPEKSGDYRLEVSLFYPQREGGDYTIRREATRKATKQDRRRVEVERLFAQAMRERSKPEGVAASIELMSQALAGWQELADNYMANLTALKIKQSRAVLLFREAQPVVNSPKAELKQKACGQFAEALGLFREAGDEQGELGSLLGAASLSLFLGDQHSAIDYFLKAKPIFEKLNNTEQVATINNDVGALYRNIGNYDKAFEYLDEALKQRGKLPNKCHLRATQLNLGITYSTKGEKARALNLLNQALPRSEAEAKDCPVENAAALSNIGLVYNDLGSSKLALEKYLLPVGKILEDYLLQPASPEEIQYKKGLVAAAKNNIGNAQYALGQNEAALESYERALSLYEELGYQGHAATVISNLGIVHLVMNDTSQALKRLNESLEISVRIGDKNGEAITLNSLGEIYSASGGKTAALEKINQALLLFRATGDPNGESIALGNEMMVWNALGNKRLAIFYGKQAITRLQKLRGAARGIENSIQRNYLQTVKRFYQLLTELLIGEGLYEQAVQVLNLYQDEQFFDFEFDTGSPLQQTGLSAREQDFAARYEASGKSLAQTYSRLADLQQQLNRCPTKVADKAALLKLQESFNAASETFFSVLKEAEKEFAKPTGEQDTALRADGISEMRRVLKTLNDSRQRTVALYTLAGNERFYVLMLKHDGTIEAFSHPTTAKDLKSKIINLFDALTDRRIKGDYLFRPAASLYTTIFGAASIRDRNRTLAAELEAYRPEVLLWSLEGNLRYIPMAALYDPEAKQFLVVKYQNAVFTRAESGRFLQAPKSWTGGIAFGKSSPSTVPCAQLPRQREGEKCKPPDESKKALAALPEVAKDLPVIGSILQSKPLINEEFTRPSFIKNIKDRPLVHISSHFCFQAGDAEQSFLLLGDNNQFTLSEMKELRNLFDGVDLLVLAACQTAPLDDLALCDEDRGREIDSLAELSQRLRAKSVIASLWTIDALGSGKFMIEMYKLRKDKPGLSKAAALRETQLKFLREEVTASQNIEHPYFWAPFVLYGNFR